MITIKNRQQNWPTVKDSSRKYNGPRNPDPYRQIFRAIPALIRVNPLVHKRSHNRQ
ncbi:MAG: hypothetical protein HZA79_03445 [Sphingobacteriales bacterium]|nr:hypothetical protein [Sphingobacteriales bacterium]